MVNYKHTLSSGANEIKVDFDTLQEAISVFDNAVKELDKYTKEFLANIDNELEEMHSDFVCDLKDTLKNMQDTMAKYTVEKAIEYKDAVQKIVDEFKLADTQLADKFK